MQTSFFVSLLRPPDHADEDLRRRAQVLYYLSLSVGLGAVIGLLAAGFVFEEKFITSFASGGLFVIALAAFVLSKTRYVAHGGILFLVTVWLLTTGVVGVSRGMRSLDIVFYISGTVVAGLLLGRRGTYVYGGASILMGAIFLLVENTGITLPNLFPFPARAGWFLLIINLVILIPAVNITLDTLMQSVERAHERLEAQKHAEFAMRESKSRFRSFIDQVSDGIVFFNDQGQVIEWNVACEHLFGVSRPRALGMYIWDVQVLITPDDEKINWDVEQIKHRIQQAFEAGLLEANSQFREAKFNKPDGSIGIGEQRLFPIQTEHGFAIGAVFRDLTERKLAEAKIQQRLNELVTVNAVSQVAASQLELDKMIQATGEKLRQIPNADCISIALYDARSQMISFPYFRYCDEMVQAEPVPLGPGLNSTVIARRQSLVINQDVEAVSLGLGYVPQSSDDKEDRPAKSWLGVPVQVGEQILGVIAVQNFQREQAFTEEDVRLWETIAANVGVAIQNAQLYAAAQQELSERKRAEEETQHRLNELATVNAISQVATSHLELDKMIQATGEKLRQIPNVNCLFIALYDSSAQMINFPYYRFYDQVVAQTTRPLGEGYTSWIIKNRTRLVINQDQEKRVVELGDVKHSIPGQVFREPKSWLGVPMQVGDQIIGVIAVQNFEREQAFTEDDVRLWETIAANVGVVIQNARLYTAAQNEIEERRQAEAKTQERLNELAIVNAVSQAAASRLELNDMIQVTGKSLQQIPNVDCLFIALYDAQFQMISFPYYRFFQDIIPAAPLRLGQGLTSRVIESRSPLLINQDTDHVSSEKGAIRHHAPGKEHRPAKSWLGVPMQIGEQIVGVIGVQNFEREHAFSENDMRLWETIAANVGVAIQNAQLYAAAQQEIVERKKLEEVQAAMAQEVLSLYVALSKIAGAPENVKALTKQVAEVVINEFNVYECGVWLLENDNTRIVRKAYVGPVVIEGEDFIPMETTGLITTVIRTGETIYAPDVRYDPRYFIGDDGTLSEFVVPLLAHGEVLGAINLESPRLDDFSERTRRLIAAFAENAALAIQNAKLVASLEQKVSELKDFQERFNFFLEHTAEGLYRIDYDPPIPLDLPYEEQYKLSRQRGRFGECNLAIAKMYGYSSREEMLAAPYYAENEGYEASMRANIEFYQRGYRSDDQETEEYTSTGEKLYFLNNVVGILREGHFVSIWGTQRDITPLKKALAALEKLNLELERRVDERTVELQAVNNELEAFSYSVSHDLRAPLRAIRGFSQILLRDFADQLDPMGRDFLDKVTNAVTEMSDKIDGLLRFSRLSRSELKWQALDLSALATEVLATLRAGDPERAITCAVAASLTARGDLVLIRNVLENLLGNAWKYSSKNPQAHIQFGATEADGKPVYYVRDNGAGFNMEYANKLFGTFQRLHRADEFEGHGIGLATVQRIIHRHGGRIWAEAEEGRGATFYFTLGRPE